MGPRQGKWIGPEGEPDPALRQGMHRWKRYFFKSIQLCSIKSWNSQYNIKMIDWLMNSENFKD